MGYRVAKSYYFTCDYYMPNHRCGRPSKMYYPGGAARRPLGAAMRQATEDGWTFIAPSVPFEQGGSRFVEWLAYCQVCTILRKREKDGDSQRSVV